MMTFKNQKLGLNHYYDPLKEVRKMSTKGKKEHIS